MIKTFLFFLGFLAFCSTFFSATLFAAETSAHAELEGILQKIESRHYRWIALRADVLLFFAKEGGTSAMCGGELLYQRLDERMFLTCADAQQELLFVFRTLDRRFDLYLPSQNTVYHGSIFDLEDSPDIDSHLKARDLFRALKPMTVDPGRTRIERTNSAITSLDVYGRGEDQDKLMRKLYLTPEGDVRGEIFYNLAGRPVTEIQRYDFRELPERVGSYRSVIFPKKVTITSPETKKGSAIFFTRVTVLDTIDPLDFILRVPDGTKEVFLDEKDPRFETAAKKMAVIPPASAVPVYLATPIKKPASKKPKPVEKSESTKSEPQESKKERDETKKTPVETPASSVAPAPVAFVNASASASADADLAVEKPAADAPAPAANDASLDPSVDPSLEIEKQ